MCCSHPGHLLLWHQKSEYGRYTAGKSVKGFVGRNDSQSPGHSLQLDGHSAAVTSVGYGPDRTSLYSGTPDGMWRCNNQLYSSEHACMSTQRRQDQSFTRISHHLIRSRCVLTLIRHARSLTHLHAGCEDKSVRLWDLRTGQGSHTFTCNSHVNTVCHHPTLPLMVSGDQSGSLCIWDVRTRRKLRGDPGA